MWRSIAHCALNPHHIPQQGNNQTRTHQDNQFWPKTKNTNTPSNLTLNLHSVQTTSNYTTTHWLERKPHQQTSKNAYQNVAEHESCVTELERALETLPQAMRERHHPCYSVSDVLTTSEPLVPVAVIAPRVAKFEHEQIQPWKYGLTLPRLSPYSEFSGAARPTESTYGFNPRLLLTVFTLAYLLAEFTQGQHCNTLSGSQDSNFKNKGMRHSQTHWSLFHWPHQLPKLGDAFVTLQFILAPVLIAIVVLSRANATTLANSILGTQHRQRWRCKYHGILCNKQWTVLEPRAFIPYLQNARAMECSLFRGGALTDTWT